MDNIESVDLLEYERQIFLDAVHEDGLILMARGLGIERIFLAMVKLYCEPSNLVLVVNTSQAEEQYIIEQLLSSGTPHVPKVVNSDCSVNDRQNLYLEGGVLFISARILVVDMLVERIPIHLVSGILVYRAHKIIDSCQEAFILRLYRIKNKTGFIKAFSDNPQSFTAGFCQIERVMKSLFVRRLFIWPRFHADVKSFLEKHKVDVVELHIQMTNEMTACQTALLDLIDACVKELKRCHNILDVEEDISTEYAITKGFDLVLRSHLDPVWHQLSSKTKQIVVDLRTLRTILDALTRSDCVNFYNLVAALRTSEKVFGTNSGWLFTEAAESLFLHSRSRLYQTMDEEVIHKLKSACEELQNVIEPEVCPKWKALREVLDEIEQDHNKASEEIRRQPIRILIAAEDDNSCCQLKEFLTDGGETMMKRLFKKSNLIGQAAAAAGSKSNQAATVAGKAKESSSSEKDSTTTAAGKSRGKERCTKRLKRDNGVNNEVTLTQIIGSNSESEIKNKAAEQSSSDTKISSDAPALPPLSIPPPLSSPCVYEISSHPSIILHPLHGSSDPHSLTRTLNELQPNYVILYDADMTFVRQIEVYKASRDMLSGEGCIDCSAIRVYFLMYSGSVEEQKYLTSLRKEKEAFEYLIRQKATMVIPEEREGKIEDDWLRGDSVSANQMASGMSRQGGLGNDASEQPQKVIVDMREFRSELPSLIHRRGIDIEPVTIEVGDYILTPDICVERKSVSDLIGSLDNGRLYNQCVAMCRAYKRPVLLIEFDRDKPFTLQGSQSISADINSNDVTSRLTLLTLHFPRLRLLWCRSPYVTAELFQQLKAGRKEPSAEEASAIRSDESESQLYAGKYNSGPQDMLLRMPGISSKNAYRILNQVESIAELATLSLQRLAEILDNQVAAKQLHDFLHDSGKHEHVAPSRPFGGRTGAELRPKHKRLPLHKLKKKL